MLIECSIYMTIINGKPVVENYRSLKNKVLKEGINPYTVRRLLLEDIKEHKDDPERVKKLYTKLLYRLNKWGHKQDPKIDSMVENIIEKEDNFEKKITELINYVYKGFPENQIEKYIETAIETYDKSKKRGLSHRESALRSIMSIPVSAISSKRLNFLRIVMGAFLVVVLIAFGFIVYESIMTNGALVFLIGLCMTIMSYVLSRWLNVPFFFSYIP